MGSVLRVTVPQYAALFAGYDLRPKDIHARIKGTHFWHLKSHQRTRQ